MDASRDFFFFSPNEQRARGVAGGGALPDFLVFSFFPCSADHKRDWPPCKKVVFFGLATNALNVGNNNNNNFEVYRPCVGGLSAVNAIGTQLRDPINSGLTQWRLAVLNITMDAAAEIGRNPVCKHEIQPEYGDEQADAGRDCRTRLARPNSQARTRTGNYS